MRERLLAISLTFFLLSATGAIAQVQFGAKGGLSVTNMLCSGSSADNLAINNKLGFFFGPSALFTMPVKNLELEASLLYDQRAAGTRSKDLIGDRAYETMTTQRHAIIPVNIRYHILNGGQARFYLFAGPQLGVNMGKKVNEIDRGEIVFKPMSFSVNAGIGLFLSRHFQISANYNLVCGKSAGHWINYGLDTARREVGKIRYNAWKFSLGYYF